ncbi:MAG: DUF3500 domain-containing protein [Dehalococcoidia bacterium]|nr:DUF3500 domain-containing protein [Dehalococcoidia bacterium]
MAGDQRVLAPETARSMAAAARDLLGTTSRLQRRRIQFDVGDTIERSRWFFTPDRRRGLPLLDMSAHQQQLALRLAATGLSEPGYNAANVTMAMENVLDRREGWAERRSRQSGRNPMRYTVALFGDPALGPWGWRFEGHHLSFRYLVAGDAVSCTPLFLGSNPARVELPGGRMLSHLEAVPEQAIALLASMPESAHQRAVIAPAAPVDIVTANRSMVTSGDTPLQATEMMFGHRSAEWDRIFAGMRQEYGLRPEHEEALRLPDQPDGVSSDALPAEARARLDGLLDAILALVPEEVARGYRARMGEGARHFAWAGPPDGSSAQYFRIWGPRLLIEYSNVQDHANHMHLAWRDPVGDFGRDLLGEAPVEVRPSRRSIRERLVRRATGGRFG